MQKLWLRDHQPGATYKNVALTYLLVVADNPLEEDIPQQQGAAHSPLEGAAKDILLAEGSLL